MGVCFYSRENNPITDGETVLSIVLSRSVYQPFGSIGVAITPDGTRAYVANEQGGTVSVIETATNQVKATLKVGKYPQSLALTADGTRLYVCNRGRLPLDNQGIFPNNGTVSVIETAEIGTEQHSFFSFLMSPVKATIKVGQMPCDITIASIAQ